MSDQQVLPGFEVAKPTKPRRSMPRFRLFFALFPEVGEAAKISALGMQLRTQNLLSGKPLAAHRLHVTLHDLGGYEAVPDELVAAAIRVAATISVASFDVVFDQVMSFPGSGAYVLCGDAGTEAASAFRQQLGVAMGESDIRWSTAFKPHMTLLYDPMTILPQAIEPVRWHVAEFALVKSHVGKTVHEILGRWSLAAGGNATRPARGQPRSIEAELHKVSGNDDQMQQEIDAAWMQRALEMASRAQHDDDEAPVGAVLVAADGALLAEGWNRNRGDCDPTAHAEIVAMRHAGLALGNHRLIGTTLYVTLEPCAMCAMAMVHARVARVVYAASDPKTGAAGSMFDLLQAPQHNHRVEVQGGVLAEAASQMLTDYFRAKRRRIKVSVESDPQE